MGQKLAGTMGTMEVFHVCMCVKKKMLKHVHVLKRVFRWRETVDKQGLVRN